MDISNIRKAVDGCEGEFLGFVLNQYDLSFVDKKPTTHFVVANSFFADDVVDAMKTSDPVGFSRCVVEFLSYCGGKGCFDVKQEGEQDETS